MPCGHTGKICNLTQKGWNSMRLIWNGHSCFTLETAGGTVVVDPYLDGSDVYKRQAPRMAWAPRRLLLGVPSSSMSILSMAT